MKRAEDSKINGFKGSYGCLYGELTRHVLKRINLHSEADDSMDDEIVQVIFPRREKLR